MNLQYCIYHLLNHAAKASRHMMESDSKALCNSRVPFLCLLKYDLVMATDYGLPLGEAAIRKRFKKLIKDHDLPEVVFHSLRHTSVTYKLKLNGGDIKAVQGDSGHAQVNMVTDVYSHILDEDRKRNAELFEEAFYRKKNLNPQMVDAGSEKMITVPDGVDAESLMKVLANPEMVALLSSLAKTMVK